MAPAILIDSNVLIDLAQDQGPWATWSGQILAALRGVAEIHINPIIYAEVSAGFDRVELFERQLSVLGVRFSHFPRAALFLAGHQFRTYRQENLGPRTSLLPDFLIGAHAAVMQMALVTRDTRRFRTYFPTVTLIAPDVV